MPAEIPFSELVDVNPRRPLKSGERYPYVEMAAVPEGGGRPTHHEEREFTGGGSRFAVGDTLFARITSCTENGKLAYVDQLPVGEVGFGSTELIVLAAKPGKADPRFVYQVAASARVRDRAISRMLGTSGRQRVPTWYFTEELTIPDIPFPEQRAIAAVLDAVDDTIERTEAVIAATEELRRALLHELLTRGVPGLHSEWKHVPGLGTVPACWEVTTLGECVRSIDYGTNAPLDDAFGGTPVVRMGDLADGDVRTGSLKRANEALDPGMLITRGDILFNRTNSIDLVGKVGYVDKLPGPTSFASYLLRLRVNERVNSRWLFELLNTPSSQQQLQRMATKGASQANINPTSLKSLPVARPGRREQELVAGLIEALRRVAATEQGRLAEVRTLKTGLASALLSGNLRVPTAEEAPV